MDDEAQRETEGNIEMVGRAVLVLAFSRKGRHRDHLLDRMGVQDYGLD